MPNLITLIDWVLVGQLTYITMTFLAVLCALFQQRIADYWRTKPNITISAKFFSVSHAAGHQGGAPYQIKIIDGKPTLDGKLIDDLSDEIKITPHTKVGVKDLVRGRTLREIDMPYIDVYIENEGYYAADIDGFFIEYCGWRRRGVSIKGSRDNVITPVSLNYKNLMYRDNDDFIVAVPELPVTVSSGDDIQFRVDPKSIKRVCELSGKYDAKKDVKRIRREYIAFTVITGKYIIRQCSRIKISAVLSLNE